MFFNDNDCDRTSYRGEFRTLSNICDEVFLQQWIATFDTNYFLKHIPHRCWQGAKYSSTQPLFICSKLTIETLEQGVKYVQS